MKRVFHMLDTFGDNRVQIPVFTGMTVFGAVLRIGGMIGVAIRRIISRSTLPWRLLKQALESRPYEGVGEPMA